MIITLDDRGAPGRRIPDLSSLATARLHRRKCPARPRRAANHRKKGRKCIIRHMLHLTVAA
eukprot:6989281-Prymnesium_polylepis.1